MDTLRLVFGRHCQQINSVSVIERGTDWKTNIRWGPSTLYSRKTMM